MHLRCYRLPNRLQTSGSTVAAASKANKMLLDHAVTARACEGWSCQAWFDWVASAIGTGGKGCWLERARGSPVIPITHA